MISLFILQDMYIARVFEFEQIHHAFVEWWSYVWWSKCVWCALAKDHIIGLFFFDESTVTANDYLDMLVLYALPQIKDGNLNFCQNGASPYYANIFDFLDAIPQCWIGISGQNVCSPLTWPYTQGLLFIGIYKQNLYSGRIWTTEHLRQATQEEVISITPDVLNRDEKSWNITWMLQIYLWGPHRTQINYEKTCKLFFHLIHVFQMNTF